jgi:hypothetical protein
MNASEEIRETWGKSSDGQAVAELILTRWDRYRTSVPGMQRRWPKKFQKETARLGAGQQQAGGRHPGSVSCEAK